MSFDVEQTTAIIYSNNNDVDNLEQNSVDHTSKCETNDDENRNCCLSEDASGENVRLLRNGLRNGLRSHDRLTRSVENTVAKKLNQNHNSPFDQLIEEAKTYPASDFELAFESSSFFSTNRPCLADAISQLNSQANGAQIVNSNQSHLIKEQNLKSKQKEIRASNIDNESSRRKVNKRKNQIELIDDFDDDLNEDESNDKMSESNEKSIESSSKNSQTDSSLKELRNFKNQPNGLQVRRFDENKSKAASLNRIELKSIQRVYIDKNLFRFDGLMNVADLDTIVTNRLVRDEKTTRDQTEIFKKLNIKRSSNDSNIKQTKLDHLRTQLQNRSFTHNEALFDKCLLFRSNNKSTVSDLYTFQDKIDCRLDLEDCQTSVIALIQLEQITIWTKERSSQDEWRTHQFRLDENQQVFRCIRIDRNDQFCILFLVCSHSLVSLKYCLIDKSTRSVQLVHGETFEVTNIDLNLIHVCFVGSKYIALSIPRIDDDIIDVLIYDKFDFKTEFNKSKRIIYMLNNVDNKFSSSTNCFLASEELDHTFLAIFNQKLFMCNVNEFKKLPRMISLHKCTDSDYSYFDVLYDKGIFYIFAGNHLSDNVRIIAINIDRCVANKLIKYDIEKCLSDDRSNDNLIVDTNEMDEYPDEKIVRIFKRKGDHLLVIKNDNTVALFNMFNDEIVYQTKLADTVDQASVAVLNQKTTILAVLNNETIVNLVDI